MGERDCFPSASPSTRSAALRAGFIRSGHGSGLRAICAGNDRMEAGNGGAGLAGRGERGYGILARDFALFASTSNSTWPQSKQMMLLTRTPVVKTVLSLACLGRE
jgi:hypothetical protein